MTGDKLFVYIKKNNVTTNNFLLIHANNAGRVFPDFLFQSQRFGSLILNLILQKASEKSLNNVFVTSVNKSKT